METNTNEQMAAKIEESAVESAIKLLQMGIPVEVVADAVPSLTLEMIQQMKELRLFISVHITISDFCLYGILADLADRLLVYLKSQTR